MRIAIMVQVDMHHLRLVGPKGRRTYEVQQVVPPALRQVVGQGTLTHNTGKRQGDEPAAAAIRDFILPQFKQRIDAARKGLEPPPTVHVHYPQRVTMGYLNGPTAVQIADVLRREFPGLPVSRRGGFAPGAWVEQPRDGSEPRHPLAERNGISQIPFKVGDAHEVVPWSEGLKVWKKQRHRDGKITDATTERRVQSKIDRLIAWLGYDDMARSMPKGRDLEAYFDSFTETAGTIKDHIIYVQAIYAEAHKRGLVASNPAASLTYSRDTGEQGQPFTPSERAKIIADARACADPEIRWTNLLAGFSGARIAELAEASTRDVVWEVDDEGNRHLVFYIRVKRRRVVKKDGDRLRVKTRQSIRFFVVHTAIRDEFAAYVDSLPPDSPLFPQFTAYGGRRNKDASNRINNWLHEVVKIDPEKSFHSWRHCIATALEGRKWGAWLTGHAGHSVRVKRYLHPPLHEVAADIESLRDPAQPTERGR
jgi:integrase